MRHNLKLVTTADHTPRRQRKPRVEKIVDKVYPKVLTEPRARIYDNIALYTNLYKSTNVQDILSCEKLAENMIEQSKLLFEEAHNRRLAIIQALGGTIA